MNELLKDLPKYKIPRFINFVNDLEKTRSGKIKDNEYYNNWSFKRSWLQNCSRCN